MDFWGASKHTSPPFRDGQQYIPGGWVVKKFGGTSIGKFPTNIADIVKAGSKVQRVAIVCSARSSSTKAEGTTNRLLRAAREAKIPRTDQPSRFYSVVEAIRNDHKQAAQNVIRDADLLGSLNRQIDVECDTLVKILESAQYLEEVSSRVEDKIVSKGEKLSCLFMTTLLQDRGVDARYVDLSDVLDAGAPPVSRLGEEFYDSLAKTMAQAIYDDSNAIPVITGYFGNIPDQRGIPGGTIRSVGRGYTDLCAALVAIGLRAKELQIWKEVDGIFTADPNRVPAAHLLESVTPSEAAELTFYGSEVVHPFTMEQAVRHLIPIRIKNVINPSGQGTEIRPEEGVPLKDHLANLVQHRGPKRPTAVTVKRNIVILNVHSNKKTRRHGFLMELFSKLDKHHLSVDLISSSEVHISLALHSDVVITSDPVTGQTLTAQNEDLRKAVDDLSESGTVDVVPHMAIVSLVGKQLKKMVGISGKLFTVLGDNNINIEMISQGASEINISCVIEERHSDRALNIIHTNLFTFLE